MNRFERMKGRGLCLCLAAVLLAGCGQGGVRSALYFETETEAVQEASEGETLLLTHSFSGGSPVDEAAGEFARVLLEAGGPAVDIYPNNTLGNVSGGFEAVTKGTVDMRIGGSGGEVMTILSWMPTMADISLEELNDQLQVGGEIYSLLEEEYRKRNVQLLGVFRPEYRLLTSNRRIDSVEDFKGLKIRIVSGTSDHLFWESLGAQPDNSYQIEEVYTALQMGLVEAEENPLATICDRKFYEQQKYLVESGMRLQINTIFVNLDYWKGLDPAQKELFRQAAAAAVKKGNELSRELVEDNYELIRSHMEILAFPETEMQKVREISGRVMKEEIIEQYGDEMLTRLQEIVTE